ncbi:MAG: hypothetical protein ABEK10_00300 [Candidatus Nanosalina sp.]
MDLDSTQKKLGIYFAAVNIISIIIAVATTVSIGLKAGLTAFLSSLIILTVIVQGYGSRQLEKSDQSS